MRNGIVINGKAYEVHWVSKKYMDTTCYLCALNSKCENAEREICEVFDKKGRIPYFVKSEECEKCQPEEHWMSIRNAMNKFEVVSYTRIRCWAIRGVIKSKQEKEGALILVEENSVREYLKKIGEL